MLPNLFTITYAIAQILLVFIIFAPSSTSFFIIETKVKSISKNYLLSTPTSARRNKWSLQLSNASADASSSSSTSSSSTSSSSPQWTDTFGSSALKQVQNLASVVSAANQDGAVESIGTSASSSDSSFSQQQQQEETGRGNGNNMSGDTDALFSNLTEQRGIKGQNRKVVLSALESLERDSTFCNHCCIILIYALIDCFFL